MISDLVYVRVSSSIVGSLHLRGMNLTQAKVTKDMSPEGPKTRFLEVYFFAEKFLPQIRRGETDAALSLRKSKILNPKIDAL